MLNSKQRAALRSEAASAVSVFQLGKDGITDGFISGCDSALTARELIKITVLKTAPVSPREAGEETARKLGAEFVAAIGNKFILYRYSKNKTEHIELDLRS